MRVISGKQKGKMLKSVSGMDTRPTTDKVKEAVFNMIGPYFNGGYGLDLFAGSGGLGIEGISRGLEKVIFIDHHYKAIQTIRNNLTACGFENNAEVYKNDWRRALKARTRRGLQFRVVWLDPPYKNHVYVKVLEHISANRLLAEDGVIVCEHATEVKLPDTVQNLEKVKTEQYGSITISIYKLV